MEGPLSEARSDGSHPCDGHDPVHQMYDDCTEATLLLRKHLRQNSAIVTAREKLLALLDTMAAELGVGWEEKEDGDRAIQPDAAPEGVDALVYDAMKDAQSAVSDCRHLYKGQRRHYDEYCQLAEACSMSMTFDEYLSKKRSIKGLRTRRTRDAEIDRLRALLKDKASLLSDLQRENEQLRRDVEAAAMQAQQQKSMEEAATAVERYNLLMKSSADEKLKTDLMGLGAEIAKLSENQGSTETLKERLFEITGSLHQAEQEREQLKVDMRQAHRRNVLSKFSLLVAKARRNDSAAAKKADLEEADLLTVDRDPPTPEDPALQRGVSMRSMEVLSAFKDAAHKARVKSLQEQLDDKTAECEALKAKDRERKAQLKRQEEDLYAMEAKLELSCSELTQSKAAFTLFVNSLRGHIKHQRRAMDEVRDALKLAADDFEAYCEEGDDALEHLDAECLAQHDQLKRYKHMYEREKELKYKALKSMREQERGMRAREEAVLSAEAEKEREAKAALKQMAKRGVPNAARETVVGVAKPKHYFSSPRRTQLLHEAGLATDHIGRISVVSPKTIQEGLWRPGSANARTPSGSPLSRVASASPLSSSFARSARSASPVPQSANGSPAFGTSSSTQRVPDAPLSQRRSPSAGAVQRSLSPARRLLKGARSARFGSPPIPEE